MKFAAKICFAAFAFFSFTAIAVQLTATPAPSPQYGDEIKCESNDGNRQYCGNYSRRQVAMQRQISQSACVYNQTWGVDRRGLWVDRGCRAIFSVNTGGPGPGGPGPGGPPIWQHPGQGETWPPSGNWNGGNWGRGGACFYTSANFGGDFFCMRRGESQPSLGSYGDNISSIRVFGRARVTVYNDRDFRSDRDTTGRDIPDLRGWRVSTNPSHTWNNRISSLQVQ